MNVQALKSYACVGDAREFDFVLSHGSVDVRPRERYRQDQIAWLLHI